MIYASFYTPGNYEKVINQYLIPSLIKFNLPCNIVKIEDKGNWLDNTAQKPVILLETLIKYKEDVIFLDGDATIEQYPSLFDQIPHDYDLAVHYLDWWKFWHNKENRNLFHLLSGTLMLRYNDKILHLVDNWIKECKKNRNIVEQKILGSLIEQNHDIKVYNLPIEYCAIINKDNTRKILNPVIEHHQASRLYRNPS